MNPKQKAIHAKMGDEEKQQYYAKLGKGNNLKGLQIHLKRQSDKAWKERLRNE